MEDHPRRADDLGHAPPTVGGAAGDLETGHEEAVGSRPRGEAEDPHDAPAKLRPSWSTARPTKSFISIVKGPGPATGSYEPSPGCADTEPARSSEQALDEAVATGATLSVGDVAALVHERIAAVSA